ncbi:hypothetical protein DERF_014020 [Dermatophagoides farinae]|uniref:Uncharacterized protein n=1 Tax=Dermatophagoides farinae TaxID=6954 RepID=A0A922HQR6_DERFA|nr:hypothetical protein DERF_014020 [Dermatophagoides farinae]
MTAGTTLNAMPTSELCQTFAPYVFIWCCHRQSTGHGQVATISICSSPTL